MMNSNQKDQRILEVRERLGKVRKRAITHNLLLSFCFCLIIIGFSGTIHNYKKLKEAKEKIAVDRDSISELNKELSISKDSLQNVKDSLAKGKIFSDSLLIEIFKNKGTDGLKDLGVAVKGITIARDSARECARQGYDLLKQYNFIGAQEMFYKSEKWYNGYRDSYEVYYLLWSNRNTLNEPAVQKKLLEQIINDYNSLGRLKKTDIR